MNEIKLEETYELVSGTETTTELVARIDENTTVSLSEFERDYNAINNNITDLCVKAHYLAQFNRQVFMEYVTKQMGLSRTSAVQMINAGDIYVDTGASLYPVTYTKVAELTPVKEQIDEYYDYIGGVASLYDKTQKEIRESVRAFNSTATEQLTKLDEDEETTEETTENAEDLSGELEVTDEREPIDVTTNYLEIKGTVEMIKAYLTEFTYADSDGIIIDKDDVRLCKSFIGNLDLLMSRVRSIIDDGGLSYSDYDPTDESEVSEFE